MILVKFCLSIRLIECFNLKDCVCENIFTDAGVLLRKQVMLLKILSGKVYPKCILRASWFTGILFD